MPTGSLRTRLLKYSVSQLGRGRYAYSVPDANTAVATDVLTRKRLSVALAAMVTDRCQLSADARMHPHLFVCTTPAAHEQSWGKRAASIASNHTTHTAQPVTWHNIFGMQTTPGDNVQPSLPRLVVCRRCCAS